MSDAITQYRVKQDLWDTARRYTCMYYDMIPMADEVTKASIEEWLSQSGRTPASTRVELEAMGLLWWLGK